MNRHDLEIGKKAAALTRHPRFGEFRGWYNTGTRWSARDVAELNILCTAGVTPDKAADTLGRSPSSVAHRARDSGLLLAPEWAGLVRPKRAIIKAPRTQLAYPYIIKKRDGHGDLLAVNRLVPQGMPGRDDVCQEIMLAMWEGKITVADLQANRDNVRAFMRNFRRDNFERSGHVISLDEPIRGRTSNEGALMCWDEVLDDEEVRDRMAFLECSGEPPERFRTMAPFGRQPR